MWLIQVTVSRCVTGSSVLSRTLFLILVLTKERHYSLQTSHYFLHPVSFFCGGSFPPEYLSRIKRPMDFGTVTSLLIEGHYQDISAFASDCRLVIGNCLTYYSDREDGALVVDQAKRLGALMSQQLEALVRYDQSPSGAQARIAAATWLNAGLDRPSESWLLSILEGLRETQYTDRQTKVCSELNRKMESIPRPNLPLRTRRIHRSRNQQWARLSIPLMSPNIQTMLNM